MKKADIEVTLIDYMGDDLRVPFVARASMRSYGKLVHDPLTLKLDFKASKIEWQGEKDERLINYMERHGHWSPFAHAFMSFHVKAPLFVARQLQKHTVGLAWNEMSRRYVDFEPEFYVPEARKRAENVKQGSSDETVGVVPYGLGGLPPEYLIESAFTYAQDQYQCLLDGGVAPEVARAVLPQSTMTEWIWSGSLAAFARVCNLRLDSHAQKESRLVAQQIHDYMKKIFPVCTAALVKDKNNEN